MSSMILIRKQQNVRQKQFMCLMHSDLSVRGYSLSPVNGAYNINISSDEVINY